MALWLLPLHLVAVSAPPDHQVLADRPRLVVQIVVDQLCERYLERWREQFEKGGFQRFLEEGAWFQNCHYPYANTQTGPGHASVSTGASPRRHGIISNEWFDQRLGEEAYCATVGRYERVPAAKPDAAPPKPGEAAKKKADHVSPERMMSPTVADALKESSNGKGKVVALSLKDRSAALPGGRRPDACYWFDTADGLFVTSTYYRDRVHPWVAEFNAKRVADVWFGKDWVHLRPQLDYALLSGPDDMIGEGKGSKQGLTFPHPTTGGLTKPSKEYYEAVTYSPFGNDLLSEFVEAAIVAEELGQDEVADLLCVSFSSNDLVGHIWGPDSQEVLDVTLRTDLTLQRFFNFLDAKIGKGKYVAVLTADHAVCALPEVSKAQGKDAKRISVKLMMEGAESHLQRTFGASADGKPRWLANFTCEKSAAYYFNRRAIHSAGLRPCDVEESLATWLRAHPDVALVYTRNQLVNGPPLNDLIGKKVWMSFHPDRSGDVLLFAKPYCIPFTSEKTMTGTTHGTPWEYDTHVPLLVYGPGRIASGVRSVAVTPQATAAILAFALGIEPPKAAEVTAPEKLFVPR